MYKEQILSISELKEWITEDGLNYTLEYFRNHPNKTVCKLTNKHRARKHKGNMFSLYMK